MSHINRITLSALLASCTVMRDFTFVRIILVFLYFFRLVKHSHCANPLSFPSLKHYIALSIFSFVGILFPFEPIELHYRLISNRSLPSFSLGLAPTMTLQLHRAFANEIRACDGLAVCLERRNRQNILGTRPTGFDNV